VNERGDLVAIGVHHQHVAVAGDVHLREVDPGRVAAGGTQGLVPAGDNRRDASPQFGCVEVVSPDEEVRHVLQLRRIGRGWIRCSRGLDSHDGLDLVGALSAALKAKLPPWLCTTMTQGQTRCTRAS
jgi:hypothetical protein